MKTFKKALAVVMCVVMTLTAAPLSGLVGLKLPNLFDFKAQAATIAEGTCGENLTWTLDDSGLLTISGYGEMGDFSDYGYGPWGDYFYEGYNISDVIIEEGVTSVSDYAFYCLVGYSENDELIGLKNVTISDSVLTIGQEAFSFNDALETVVIGCGVTSIGEAAFLNCYNLKKITIPYSVVIIADYAFCDCSNISSVEYYGSEEDWSMVTVGEYNEPLTDAMGFDSFIGSEIPSNACGSRVTWDLTDSGFLSIKGIGAMFNFSESSPAPWADNISDIKTVYIESGVTTVGNNAFSGCTNLTSITIPDGIISIGENTFNGCSKLVSITLPESLKSIGENAFRGCNNITEVVFKGSEPSWYAISVGKGNDIITSKVTFKEAPASQGTCGTKVNWALDDNGNLLISGTGKMHDYEYKRVLVWNQYQWVCTSPFSDETSIKTIVIKDGVTSIGDYAFYQCTGLENITIPTSVKDIGESTFTGCSNIENVFYTGTVADWCTINKGNLFERTRNGYSGDFYIDGNLIAGELVIPEGVTSIASEAFSYLMSITNIRIPDSVTRIGDNAFYNTGYYQDEANWENGVLYSAKHLINAKTTISGVCTIKEGTTCIAEKAFRHCDSITSISIPDSVTSIPCAFYDCDSLTKVTIGAGVKTIESSAFYSCEKITDVYYNGGSKDWANITIGSNNTYLTDAKFHYSYHYITWIVVDNIIVDRIKVGEKVSPFLTTERTGYTFDGWDCGIPDIMPEIDLKATAQYTPITYYAKFVVNGEIIETIPFTVETKSIEVPEIPAVVGYTGNWEKYELIPDNIVVNAIYTINSHTITWDADGETTVDKYEFGDGIVKPVDPKKDYYIFTGWDSEIPAAMPDTDLTFTAQFAPITYNAEFVVDGKVVGTVPYTVESETIEAPEVPPVVGYTGAWEDYELTPGGIIVNAVYTANPHTVTWNIDGVITVDNYNYGDEIVKPADPEKEGHTFTGWDKEIVSTVPDEDLVYKATWKKNSYTVKWNIDGVITEEPYVYGDEITAPVPEKDGMFFVGWGEVVPKTMPGKDLEFIAQWNKNNFEYEKDENGNVTITGAKDASGDIEIPDNINGYSVTAIAEAAFAGSDITSVTIPEGVETIGECAFAYCENLKAVNIPASVSKLGETAFVGSTNIEKIDISADNESYATDEYGVIYNKDFTLLIYAPAKSVGEAYTMRSTTESACDLSFADCTDFALTLSDGFSVDSSSMFFDILTVTGFVTGSSCVNYKAIDGVLYNKAVTTLIKYPVDSKRELLIPPASVKYIVDEYAFVTPEVEKSVVALFGLDYDSNTFANMYREPEYLTVHIDSFYDFDSDSLVFLMMGPSHVCFGDTTKSENDQLNEIADNAIANIESQWEEKKDELTPGSIEYYYNEAFVLGYVDLITSYIDCYNDHTRLHKYAQVVETKDPTCAVDGYVNYDCDCGYEFTDVITAPGHDYESVITEPTCTEKGFTTHTCSVCGDTYTDSEVKENGHSYESVVTKVTCTTDGYTTHTCSVCKDSYTDSIVRAEGHKYDSVVTPNTCTTDGYTTHTCSVCDDTYTDSETKATGHSHESKVTKEPTCTNTGVRTFTCHCGDSYTEVIKANGHTKGEWEYIGGKEYAKSCTVCGDKLESKIVTVDMFFNSENVNKKQVLNKSTATVTATVTDNFVNDLVFASSDSGTVSVDANGNVVANNIGKATITVTIKGTAISDSIEVEVLPRDFTVTWNVNGKQTKQTVKEEAKFTPNVNTTLKGYKFIGWDKTVPTTMPAENLTFTAQYELIVKQLKVKNPSTSTINYGETLVMHADFGGVELPEGWSIQWTVEGAGFDMAPAADGLTCKMTSVANGTATVKATIVDENGEAVLDADSNEMSDSKQLTSKAGFFQKLASFFKNLFGISRIILQSI